MSGMKLYNVTAILVFPVGASSSGQAEALAEDLFKDPKPDELGFKDFLFQAEEVTDISELSGEWQVANLFNSEDEDCLTASDVLSNIKHQNENLKDLFRKTAAGLREIGVSETEISELIKN